MNQECLELIKGYTRHKHAKITNSGNLAIFAAMAFARHAGISTILVPDQGGWLTYLEYPKILGLEMQKIETDKGLINPRSLELHNNKAIIFSSFAGYFAEQPLKEIAQVCKEHNILLIEDATGAIGDDTLCNGEFSDIIVGSFGKDKPVNLGQGGFISWSNDQLQDKDIFTLTKPVNLDYAKLHRKLKDVRQRLQMLFSTSENIKKDLKNYNLIHSDRRGINVVAANNEKILEYCGSRGYECTMCPRYIRVDEDAISIEVKRL